MTLDSHFAGSIPALYEKHLVPVLFAPFAADIVRRVVSTKPHAVLELACGTGAVSHPLAMALPDVTIVATDLNAAMLGSAGNRATPPNLSFQVADAQALPFPDSTFDVVLAQFGVMFFTDKIAAYREACRVLTPGGTLIFSVWDKLEANSGSAVIHHAVRDAVPEPKPDFMVRTPFGYNDPAAINHELYAAGFDHITIERVELTSPHGSAAALAKGMCLGSPLANELAVHPAHIREQALAAAITAAESEEAKAPLSMAALVFAARPR